MQQFKYLRGSTYNKYKAYAYQLCFVTEKLIMATG